MYATPDDMRAEYGEDTLVQIVNAPSWDEVAIARINRKLASATARADGYVAKYYSPQPGTPVPELLKLLVCEIAFADLQENPTEEATKRRDRALRDLENISKGLMKIDGGNPEALKPREGAVLVPAAPRLFSRDTLSGF